MSGSVTIIGSAHVQIRADDKYFESDVRKATAKIKNVAIQLKADVDLTKASKKIRDLRYRITSKDAVLKVDANVVKAEEKLAKLLSKFLTNDLEFKAVANTKAANTELGALKERYAKSRVNMTATADTRAANAALAFAARPRKSNITALVDAKSQAALQGLFNTITGTISATKIKAALSGVAANFEGLAVKATLATTAILALSGSVLTLGGNLLSIAGDITQVIGLSALIPTAIGSMVSIIVASKMAWKGFAEAMSSDAKKAAAAMEKLPPQAQAAAKALKGVYTEIQKPVQKAFWESMNTSLQDTVATLLPSLKEGLSDVGRSLGSVTREVLLAFGRMGDGTLLNMLKNLGVGLENMAPGFGALIDAFAILGETGSTYLPRFGEWATELATRFKSFIEEAEKTGKINEWINTGIQRLKEMGSIVKSTAGFFSGLTTAARMAGAPGLTEMAEGMRNIRDIVNGEPFQSRLVTILEGARKGTEALGEGFGDLTGFIGDSSETLGYFLEEAGEIAGLTFENIRNLFDGTGLGTGLYAALQGLKDLMKDIQPGVRDLGIALGGLSEIAGEVIRALGPGLNQLFETIRKVIYEVKDGVIAVIPVFNDFIQAIMYLAQGPIVMLADGLGNLLSAFAGLPDPIQTLIMSAGLFLVLAPKLLGFWDNLNRKMGDQNTRFGRNFTTIREGFANAGRSVQNFDRLGTRMGIAFAATADGMHKSMGRVWDAMPPKAQAAATGIKNAFKDFGAGFSSGLNLSREFDTVRTGLDNVASRTKDTFRGMGDTIKSNFSRFGEWVAPAGGAVRTMVNGINTDFDRAKRSISGLATHAVTATKNAASQIGAGLKTAGGGLMDFIGGPWGIALLAATAVLGEYATQQAKVKQQVDDYATAFEQSGGRIDAAVRKITAANLAAKDSWFGIEFESAVEIAKKMNVSLEDMNDAAAGVPGAMEKVKKATEAAGEGATKAGTNFQLAKAVFEENGNVLANGIFKMADATGLFSSEGDKLNAKIGKQNQLMAEAKKQNEDLAKQLGIGTVASARLSANYDTLADAAASVGSRVDAMKDNLDILNGSMLTARDGARDQAEAMFDLDDAMKKLPGAGEGIIDVNGRMQDAFRATLTEADGTFKNTSRGAIEFSKEMDSAAESILTSGMNEMKRLQDLGKSLPEAQAGALETMNKGTETLRTKLGTLGFDAGQVQLILSQLGLNPEKLQGALVLDTADAEGEAVRFELFMGAIKEGNWEVALTASSDAVKEEILKTEGYKKAFEDGGWDAVIGLIDEAGPGIEQFMVDMAKIKDGDRAKINAVLDAEWKGRKIVEGAESDLKTKFPNHMLSELSAQDATKPGVDAAAKTLEGHKDKTAKLLGIDATAPAKEQAQGTMETLTDVTRKFFGFDSTAPAKDQAQGTMGLLQNVTRSLFGKDEAAAGKNGAQRTMNSLVDVVRSLFALNEAASGKNAAQGTVDLFKGKEVKLTADDQASGVVRNVDNTKIANKSFSIVGVLSGVSDAVRSMLGMYNGGIIGGNGAQKFANGGFSGVKAPAIKAFANGGTENHVAQIARGAWPVRIWAEPETGGEAYVPLHPSKRKRSLQILEEVASIFGYSLAKKFANGGFMSGMKTSTPSSLSVSTSSSYVKSAMTPAGKTTVINQTINPSQGLSEAQIADAAATELFWRLDNS